MSNKIDYEQWAKRFAEITEDFVWLHSGAAGSEDLNRVFREALNALVSYNKQVNIPAKISLKQSMRSAYYCATENGTDPWAAVLEAIAERADDWAKYISEDDEVTQDIRRWLIAESAQLERLPASPS